MRDKECEALSWELYDLAGDVAKTEYWFRHDDDVMTIHTGYSQIQIAAGASFCSDCVILIEGMLGLPSRDKWAWNIRDTEEQSYKRALNTGGCAMEHDLPQSCDWCGATLQYVLLEWSEELDGWLHDPEKYNPVLSKSSCYELCQLFECLSCRSKKDNTDEIIKAVDELKAWARKWISATKGKMAA